MRDEELAGATLADRYDLLAKIGSGGMGTVYRAQDRELDEQVALKVIREHLAGERALARFRHEVKLARRVTHRNVARTFELGHADGITFCTMELIEGESLRTRIRRAGKLAVAEAVAIAREVCAGLTAAHAAGVIHRDIKPDNILIARDGRIVLADFGVAAGSVEPGENAGTPAYMAPEQARGEAPSPAADIYALGVVLREMVTGKRHGHIDAHAPDLARVIDRATAEERDQRIGSAAELARILEHLSSEASVAPPTIEDHDGDELRTVIVLPPRASDGSQLPLAVGVHEQVLARLTKVPRVRAIARASALAEPADAVIELVAGGHLVATITRPAGAPMTLQLPLHVSEIDEAAAAIASAVASAVEQRTLQLAPQAAEAIELMLRAKELAQRDLTRVSDGFAWIERANALLPGDPRIAAVLAIYEVRLTFFSMDENESRIANARRHVAAALAAGPHLAETHIAAGQLELNTGDPILAARHFRQAIACAPHVAEAHETLGRMLLEAGFLEDAFARLEDAIAMAPSFAMSRWEVARAYALEGRWDDCQRMIDEMLAGGTDRLIARLRLRWWRRDMSLNAYARQQNAGGMRVFYRELMERTFDTVDSGRWDENRDALIALVLAPSPNPRRRSFAAQFGAEVAGYFHDDATALQLVEHAIAAGLYDLHWLDKCPLLEGARSRPGFRRLRAHVQRRAEAILDALYGDDDAPLEAETRIG